MKRFNYLLSILIVSMILLSQGCSKQTTTVVNKDGLTDEIVNLVPDSIINGMKDLGMPIFGGATPPDIENSFLASPFVLKASNRQGDNPGYTYSDMYLKFYNQDNKKLTTNVSYVNGPESGEGLGSYIVGDKNSFSVFVDVKANANDGSEAKIVIVVSGTVTDAGIEDLYYANFMINNYGNATGYWIENGEGRVIYDSDGISPTTDFSNLKSASTGAGSSSKKDL